MTHICKFLTAITVSSVLLTSCGQGTGSTSGKDSTSAPYPAISIKPVGFSPDFPNATLSIASVSAAKQGADSAKVSFKFDVKNYELKMQTSDKESKLCNNSDKGQHIHFILDNQPYKALYEPMNDVVVANGSEHYLMAFLSRSYHESLKNKEAAVICHFSIDKDGNMKKLDDPKTPMVFYSRPKGDYIGKDTANVLLDFYVWNCGLSNDGYKVKAKIENNAMKGHDTTLTITKWEANFLENMGQGKSTVTLTLVDKDGKTVDGPNTTVSRTIQLAADEPMKK